MAGHRVASDMAKAPLVGLDPGDAGTMYCDKYGQVFSLTSAGAETRTLAAPEKAGLVCTVAMAVDVGDITLTVTGGYNNGGSTSITLDDAGDAYVFQSVLVATTPTWRLLNPDSASGAQAHIADPAAMAAITGAVVGDTVATSGGWGSSTEAGFDSMHVAIDANNAAIDSILVALENAGILLTS